MQTFKREAFHFSEPPQANCGICIFLKARCCFSHCLAQRDGASGAKSQQAFMRV